MVDAAKIYTIGQLENMTEAELEAEVQNRNSDDARYVLGKLQLEGTSDKIKKNEKKGINWIKEASKNGHMGAKEYKVYHDVRYDRQPNMKKLLSSLEEVIEKTKSTRALNMLAEFNQI
jgi:TPR repeat protein